MTITSISAFKELLYAYNEHTNIYSKTAYTHLDFHIENSIRISNHLPTACSNIVDIGSGSGLPAIPLSLTTPTVTITAIESKSRKTRFLSHVKQTLSIENLHIKTSDINEYLRAAPTPDCFTAKAFAPLHKILNILIPTLKRDTWLIIPISPIQARELTIPRLQEIDSYTIITDDRHTYLKLRLVCRKLLRR
ncbi:hypothetical protein EB093_00315 [bacterium]|nr:hypothetical protein [bacterium]